MASSTWDDIRTTVDSFAKKVNRKAEQLTESAAIHLKTSAKKAELDEEYGKLGKLTFARMYDMTAESATPIVMSDEDSDTATLDQKIAASVARITELREEIQTFEKKTDSKADQS